MFNRVCSILVFSSVALTAHADFMCPSTYKYVNIGDTEGQVLASCGDPLSKKQSEQSAAEKMNVETLVYAIQADGTTNAPVDPRYELTFADNRLIRIKSESGESESMDVCRGETVRLGASIYDVISFCGTPVNRFSGQIKGDETQVKVKAEDWFYQFGTTQVKMRFIEGALHDITPATLSN